MSSNSSVMVRHAYYHRLCVIIVCVQDVRVSHVAMIDSTQYTDGITGALLVHPFEPSPPDFPTWDQELVVQMNDWYHTFSTKLSAAYLSVSGDFAYFSASGV